MTEISKIFENAGLIKGGFSFNEELPTIKITPYFTTEKQIKIIEWLISYRWWLNLKSLDKKLDFFLDFDEKLAKLVNRLWESFNDQEKEEIRNILNA